MEGSKRDSARAMRLGRILTINRPALVVENYDKRSEGWGEKEGPEGKTWGRQITTIQKKRDSLGIACVGKIVFWGKEKSFGQGKGTYKESQGEKRDSAIEKKNGPRSGAGRGLKRPVLQKRGAIGGKGKIPWGRGLKLRLGVIISSRGIRARSRNARVPERRRNVPLIEKKWTS